MWIPFLSWRLQSQCCGSAHPRVWWISCTNAQRAALIKGSAPTSLWKQGAEHYSSVEGRQIWLTSLSSQVLGTFNPHTWKDRWIKQLLSCVNYLWPVLSVSRKVICKTSHWFSWWLNIKNYEVTLWNVTLKEISVPQLNAGIAKQSMQQTISKL